MRCDPERQRSWNFLRPPRYSACRIPPRLDLGCSPGVQGPAVLSPLVPDLPHTPNPEGSSLLESISASAQAFSLSMKGCLCLGIVMACVDTLKNIIFFKLVPSNTNHLICKPACDRGRNIQQREVFARAGPALALGRCTLSKAESFNSSSSWGQE